MHAVIDETIIVAKDFIRLEKQVSDIQESVRTTEKDIQHLRHLQELSQQRADQRAATMEGNVQELTKTVAELSTIVTKLGNIIETQQRTFKWGGAVFVWVVTSLLLPFFSESIKGILTAIQ